MNRKMRLANLAAGKFDGLLTVLPKRWIGS